ncbi:MAG: hypothetical protein E6J78_04625 [Deltaproteobacteria bacterium]|nr:MAG: hypothetical protein E6J78_04625 [Deltaproteobacteria bacterium]
MNQRGFTILEVLVGAAVAILVIGIVMATFLSQQKSMQSMDLSREASNGARDSMFSMQGSIGRAGYGVDPRYAFDFKWYNCTTVPCRDKINGADELVFVERDPIYYWAGTPTSTTQGCSTDTTAPCTGHAWPVKSFDSATQMTISADPDDLFLLGQVVMVTCAKGLQPTMGTIATTIKATSTGNLQLTLTAAVAGNPYKTNVVTGADPCFGSIYGTAGAGVSMFLVNRYHYLVTIMNGDPWLVLDRGLDYNQNGTTPENGADPADYIPIAHGVEDMQIAYLLRPPPSPWPLSGAAPTAPDNGADWVVGDTVGTVEEPNPSATAPTQDKPDTDASRYTLHPANIRGVRVRLMVRSLLMDHSIDNFAGDAYPASIENRNDFTAIVLGGYRRYPSSISVATPNLNSRDPFIF